MRGNEEWQDSNSFIYTDPRFDGTHFYSFQLFIQLRRLNVMESTGKGLDEEKWKWKKRRAR